MLIPFHRSSTAVMAVDIMGDLGLNAPEMGLLASTFFVIFGIMQVFGGVLTDGLGPRRLLPVMVAISGLGAFLFSVSHSLFPALAARALMGFGVSTIFLCGLKLIGAWFPPAAFAKMTGILLGVGGMGAFLASAPLAKSCAVFGWRTVFFVFGVMSVLFALGLRVSIRDTPQGNISSNNKCTMDWEGLLRNARLVISNRNFWLACLWMFCNFNMNLSFSGLWGAVYLKDVHHLAQVEIGNVLNMTGLGILTGGLLAGWLNDTVFKSYTKTMAFTSIVMTLLFMLLVFAGASLPLWSLYVWFLLNAAFGVPMHSVAFCAMRDTFGPATTATACGLLNSLPSMGVLLFQPLTGAILEIFPKTSTGFSPEAHTWGCLFYLAAGIIGLWAVLSIQPVPQQQSTISET